MPECFWKDKQDKVQEATSGAGSSSLPSSSFHLFNSDTHVV